MNKVNIDLQDIHIKNATQRTITIIGGKGVGKTSLMKMFLKQESPILCYDPLGVIKSDAIDANRIILKTSDIDSDKLNLMMRSVNATLKKDKNVILSFRDMVQSEEIGIADLTLPKLNLKDGYVFFDEIHEFVPLYSQSTEVERYIRHCRNKNVGVVISTQRPASVHKNVLALTDYLILFRLQWTHDLKAVKELLSHVLEKDELNNVLKTLPTLGFMEGYIIDYRSKDE